MKKLINITNIVLIIFSITLFVSCSGDDDSPAPTAVAPTLTVNESNLEIMFFHAGNATPYSVDWHGEQGTYSFSGSLDGLSINSTTGEMSWTNQLPLGIHTVKVVATNSVGSTPNNL